MRNINNGHAHSQTILFEWYPHPIDRKCEICVQFEKNRKGGRKKTINKKSQNSRPPKIISDNEWTPETKIIQDRAYNSKSLSSAYKQLTPVQDVQWDYRTDPTKIVLDFGSGLLTDDMMPLGPRRGEAFITARTSEDGGAFYCTAERYRAVTLVTRDAVVADTVSGILVNMCINTILNWLILECAILPSLAGDNHRVS